MFGINKDIHEKMLNLEFENEKLKKTLSDINKKEEYCRLYNSAITTTINKSDDFGGMEGFLKIAKLNRIEIIAVIRAGGVDECFVGMWHGVIVYAFNNKDEAMELFKITVDEISDDGRFNDLSIEKRLNLFKLTVAIAEYVKFEITNIASVHNLKIEVVVREEKSEFLSPSVKI